MPALPQSHGPAPTARRRGGLRLLLVCTAGGLALGGGAGGLYGYASGPLVTVSRTECATASGDDRRVARAGAGVEDLLSRSWASNLELAARIGSLERLRGQLEASGVSAGELAEVALAGMSDEQIRHALARVVGIRNGHLADVDDLRRYTARLASLALEGTLAPARDEPAEGLTPIHFATERELEDPASVARSHFSSEGSSLYAIFDVREMRGRPLLVKWIQLAPARILLFRRISPYSTSATSVEHFSYGIHRSLALQPGRYEVSVYSGDAALEPLARGQYEVE